jgi:hypothetical protein
MKKVVLTVLALVFANFAWAEQPRLERAIEGYGKDSAVIEQISALEKQGYRKEGDTLGTMMILNGISDEGPEAVFLVSTYFEKGDQPWELEGKLLSARVYISAGHVSAVRIVEEK